MTTRSPQRQALQDLLDPVVSAAGYELVDLSVSSAGRRSLLRVTVDGEDGIDLDGVAEVSRAISTAMDAQDADFAGPYVLEVSSPGVDRPLTEPRHWRRAAGRLVSVPIDDGEPVTGRVLAADESGLSLRVAGSERRYGWEVVGTGRMQVEFARPGQPLDEEPESGHSAGKRSGNPVVERSEDSVDEEE
jgi:ribosome maturation factor RimP